ncbi:similar to Saccharomyces cerevisiae YCR077C PAT1 Topoisomerase II-associated deadenylation-dependent mRNA-decapping factor [Maudiozyma saulgeensis]|uniref:Similar to Saccharomyces cerevisiae YCR077C PAT1 Topoisomerase II-associated deadenylation-dependent mRNA-decapping factor n=1 Tax=Maudiozyma saulgeensis TaxID=1789683 RepID=A0A1X7R517_9SACH|nr:similar to Saccharomyces cerevisiae YCR077C PAT1 Topoisomerase II-associated deadenylation-dependent mRNA-decapping factor [Kazachstania saulgeensis]
MSFFGFDPTAQQHARPQQQQQQQRQQQQQQQQPLDFEETYKGYGDYEPEEEDFLNDETFGNNVELGNNFDFGHSQQQQQQQQPAAAVAAAHVTHRSYVAAAASGTSQQAHMDAAVDLRPMESLWNPNAAPAHAGQAAAGEQVEQQPRVLSMEEIERNQRQMQMHPPPLPPQGYPAVQGYPMPPGNFMPPPGQNYPMMAPPQQQQQFQQQMRPVFNQPNYMGYPGNAPPPHQQQPQQQQQQPQQQMVPPQMQMPPQQQMQQAPPHEQKIAPQVAVPQMARSSSSLSQSSNERENFKSHQRQSHQRQPRNREPLTPEEQKRLEVRHAKVEKILKHSGLMTPRDKDFITRYQLSQIVTEDPYNEDFYFQVYKIIQRGGVVGESNKGLIARAYLEHSGHRLGGRYKRADIALQRMQSQVEKAVTVAKERPLRKQEKEQSRENSNNEGSNSAGSSTTGQSNDNRDGVLGKISSSLNSKAPRRQLQIPTSNKTLLNSLLVNDEHATATKPTNPDALMEVTESLGNVELSQKARVRRRSSYAFTSVDQSSVLSRSGGRKFVLSLIETVYEEVLELEANLRSGKPIDNKNLWDALHINDELYEVCPFISMLSFDKGVKIMPRIFNFLEKDQKLKLLQTFFSELSHLNIIIISSYKTNPEPTEFQLKQIDVFQTVFLKIIVSFLSSSSNFIEIMGLLLHLIKNNNVSFISTSKIGLNLITVLISRAALIRQDTNRNNMLSSPEISTWNEIYDKLFTALESKLAAVFPPKEYIQKVNSVHLKGHATPSASPQHYDQAYIWQFLASLALSGKLNHQRIIIDEVRDQIFGTITEAEQLKENAKTPNESDDDLVYRREKLYQDLNLFLNVMGLVSRDGEISELK